MTKAIMATATTLLALCLAIQFGCGSLRPAAPPTPLPPSTPLPAPPALAPTLAPIILVAAPPPPHPIILEKAILNMDAVARVRLIGVNEQIAIEKGSRELTLGNRPGPYVGVVEFRFEVLEWLKGGDGSDAAVGVHIVANGRTEHDALADGARYSGRRDKRWDNREAIVFMNNSHKDAPSTRESGRYLIGYRTWQGYDSFSFNALRTWLPRADASQSSSASGEPEFLLQDPDGESARHISVTRDADGKVVAETLSLTKLRNLVALSAEDLDERALRQEGLGVTDTSMSPETNIRELHAVTRLGEGTYIIWSVSETNPDVIGYRLLRRKGSDPELIELTDEPVDGERGYVDTHDIQPGTEYIYTLRAYGEDGDIADAHLTITTRPALDPLDDATATPAAIPTATTPTTSPISASSPAPTPTAIATIAPTATPSPTPTPSPDVIIRGIPFAAEIADTPALRTKGLGYRDQLAPSSGMLFVFPSGQASSFWMRGMRFPLDFVWIGADCRVADITERVPHPEPGAPDAALPLINPAAPAAYTFEINAGEIEQFGIEIGDAARFRNIRPDAANSPAAAYPCDCRETEDCDAQP